MIRKFPPFARRSYLDCCVSYFDTLIMRSFLVLVPIIVVISSQLNLSINQEIKISSPNNYETAFYPSLQFEIVHPWSSEVGFLLLNNFGLTEAINI